MRNAVRLRDDVGVRKVGSDSVPLALAPEGGGVDPQHRCGFLERARGGEDPADVEFLETLQGEQRTGRGVGGGLWCCKPR